MCCWAQVDEVREISVLAKDAAEILWEMVAMGESGGAVADMQSKAEQLQVGGGETSTYFSIYCFSLKDGKLFSYAH